MNTAPTGTSATIAINEDVAHVFTAANFGFSDFDGHAFAGVVITTLPTNGALTLAGVAVVAGSFVNAADIAAGNLVFTPGANANGINYSSFTFQVRDNGGTLTGGSDTDASADTISFNVTAVNDAPVNAVPASQSGTEDADLVFSTANGNALMVADAEAASLTVTLSVGQGTLTLASTTGLTFTSGDGTADSMLTFSGTAAAINAALDGLIYRGNLNYNGSDSLSITTSDNGQSGSGGPLSDSDVVAITLAAVNDAPVVAMTAGLSATEQVASNLKGSMSVADPDAGAGTITATLAVDAGILNVTAGTSGAVVSGSGTGSVTITGTLAQINDLLGSNATSSVDFVAPGDVPPASATLTLSVNDGGNSGTGGALIGSASQTIVITAVNDAPVNAVPASQSGTEDADLVFSTANGNALMVADAEAASLTVTLSVGQGTLTLASTTGLTFTSGDGTADSMPTFSGTAAAINAALDGLIYRGNLNYNGSDSLSITTSDNGQSGSGGPLSDSDVVAITLAADGKIDGTSGDDVIEGTTGADTMVGYAGNDTYTVNNAGDVVIEEPGGGADWVKSSITHTLAANVEHLRLLGSDAIDGTGNGHSNRIIGNSASNVISTGAGNDWLDGRGGADTMIGGTGHDTYSIDHAGDVVTELTGEGIDRVYSSVSHTLAANVEHLTLIGTAAIDATGNTLANTIRGNVAANTLTGGAGNDVLNGGGGADTLVGGIGNDIYFVDDSGDVVIEVFNHGTSDRVRASVSYTLSDNVEHLILTGSADLSGTGNALDNSMIGNSGANTLTGAGGHDSLNGGAGADAMFGGSGNDIYIVDNAGDVVTEALGEGLDMVRSSVSYTLSDNVERLALTGSGANSGTGNAIANKLIGNSAANTLRGEGASDVIVAGGGDDHIYGGLGVDSLTGGAGADSFYFDTRVNGTNVDKVRDFAAADDTLVLSQTIFTAIGLGTLDASAFQLGTAADDAGDRIIYDSATGKLYYDADGNGAGAQLLFAQVTASTVLTHVDFQIVG